MTPLERTIVMLQAAPEDPARFSAVLERLCDAEVFLALEAEASDENITPKMVERDGQSYVAIFDTELHLAEAVGGEAGLPFELHVLRSDRMSVVPGADGWMPLGFD